MKRIIYLAVGLLAFNIASVFGQQAGTLVIANSQEPPPKPALTKFNLDFPGGTPAALVKAIEKAMGKPLNAIIPTEDADIQLPPLKMNDVVTPQLFAALQAASRKIVAVQNGPVFGNSYTQESTEYGFTTADNAVSDTSIWYFHVEKPNLPPAVSNEKICRFYSLDPYLNRGFTVDDVTTAIEIGWRMAGIKPRPTLNYHKETKLLIAYGEPSDLLTIQNVLNSLPATKVYLGDVEDLRTKVYQLQKQVDELTKRISAQNRTSHSSPEENSGK